MQCHQLALEAGITIIRSVKKPKETLTYRISHQEMFEKNMNALRAIKSTIILCGKQNISLRGHRDDSTSTASNKGNFHAILMLMATLIKIFKNTYWLEKCYKHLKNCTRGSYSHHWRVYSDESYTADSEGRHFFLNHRR